MHARKFVKWRLPRAGSARRAERRGLGPDGIRQDRRDPANVRSPAVQFRKMGPEQKREALASLENSYLMIKVGIFAQLCVKYLPIYGKEQANFLAVAVTNEALLLAPANRDAETYLRKNRANITAEAMKLSLDPTMAKAFSYLYAVRTIYLTYATGSPSSRPVLELGKRATELSIYIPNTYDICGSGDFFSSSAPSPSMQSAA
jgi:hypothetical protein